MPFAGPPSTRTLTGTSAEALVYCAATLLTPRPTEAFAAKAMCSAKRSLTGVADPVALAAYASHFFAPCNALCGETFRPALRCATKLRNERGSTGRRGPEVPDHRAHIHPAAAAAAAAAVCDLLARINLIIIARSLDRRGALPCTNHLQRSFARACLGACHGSRIYSNVIFFPASPLVSMPVLPLCALAKAAPGFARLPPAAALPPLAAAFSLRA